MLHSALEIKKMRNVGDLKERGQSEGLDIDGKIVLEMITEKCNGRVWNGFMWFRIETRIISWVSEWPLASQEGLCSTDLT